MNIKIGTDISSKKRFLTSLHNGKDAFLQRLFTPQEIRQNTHEQLASIFCLKEAVIKALEIPQDSWLAINSNRKANGKVECSFVNPEFAKHIISLDSSISHEGELIVAVAVVILEQY